MSGSGQTLFVRYGNFLFKDRKIIFPLVLVVLLFGFRPRQPAPGTGTGIDTALIGWLLAAIGEGIRVAVIGLAYIKRGGRNKRVYADVLVAEGIFHHCRNPLYLGNLLIVTGLFVIHSNPWVYLIGTMFFFTAYSAIVAAEESYLFGKFGKDYERYCNQVNRWLPRLTGLVKTLKSMRFSWRRVVAKDYASTYSWMVLALAIMAYRYLLSSGTDKDPSRLITVCVLFVAMTCAFAVVRYLKKSGRLVELV